MPMDLDEHDLYPPDIDPARATPEARHARNRAAIGTALLVWGTSLFVHRAMHVDLDTGFLGLGLGALAGWTRLRRYGWFIAGAVLTSLGLGEVLGVVLSGAFGAAVSAMLIAAGFGAVYVRYPQRSRWALVPAAVFAGLAVLALGLGVLGLVPHLLGSYFLPLVLIAGGGLLVFRQSLPPRTVKIGLLALAGLLVFSAAASAVDGPPWPRGGPVRSTVVPIGDRTLELVGGSGDLDIVQVGGGTVSVRGRRDGLQQMMSADAVRFVYGSHDYQVRVPMGTDVRVTTGSGDVDITADEDASWSVATGSGDIEVDGDDYDDGYRRSSETGPRYSVRTGSGDVEISTGA